MGNCGSDTPVYTFEQSVQLTLPKILGVAKNYLKQAIEAGAKDIPTSPIYFQKPWSSLVYAPHHTAIKMFHPSRLQNDIRHEIELGIVIGKTTRNISKEAAMDHIAGYFLVLDMTDGSVPMITWDLAKGQDGFCPVSPYLDKSEIPDPLNVELQLKINDKTVQKDITGNMHFKIDELIATASQYMTLNHGDLILSGTPAGIGSVKPKDKIHAVMRYGGKEIANMKFVVE